MEEKNDNKEVLYGRFEFQNGTIYEGNYIQSKNGYIKEGEGILIYQSIFIRSVC